MQKKKTTRTAGREPLATITTSTPPPEPRLVGALKVWEAAQYLSVSPPTVRRLIARGFLRPNRATRHILLSVRELDRFLAEGQVE
jgi:excisionase family DNA binding protein